MVGEAVCAWAYGGYGPAGYDAGGLGSGLVQPGAWMVWIGRTDVGTEPSVAARGDGASVRTDTYRTSCPSQTPTPRAQRRAGEKRTGTSPPG
jgi:hypothetical protein